MDWSTVKHFSRSEFGRNGDIEPDETLVRKLDEARDAAGVPFGINSAIRTPEKNQAVGGVPDSAHVTGYAVDIRCPTGRHRFLMLRALFDAGFTRIGVGNTFIHVDTDPTKPAEVVWLY